MSMVPGSVECSTCCFLYITLVNSLSSAYIQKGTKNCHAFINNQTHISEHLHLEMFMRIHEASAYFAKNVISRHKWDFADSISA